MTTHEFDNPSDQAERKAVLKNDRRVREEREREPTTMFAMAQAADLDGGGRYSGRERPAVTGAAPAPMLPAASWQHDPTGPEPRLGFRVDDLPNLLSPTGEWPQPAAEEQTDEA